MVRVGELRKADVRTGVGARGGDVLFDGLDASRSVGPAPGWIELQGAGGAGDFESR